MVCEEWGVGEVRRWWRRMWWLDVWRGAGSAVQWNEMGSNQIESIELNEVY